MAGAEKVCEFSGEYPGHKMYQFKRNLIQIMPKYRKQFRGAAARLHVFRPCRVVAFKSGGFEDCDPQNLQNYDPPFDNKKDYARYIGARVVDHYEYALEVFDPSLRGDVNGLYVNWTVDLAAVKRKLKRLLRVRRLDIVYHDCSYIEYKEQP